MNRRWTIRARILTLLLAPALPLLAMLVFATSVTLTPALNLRNARIAVDDAGLPAATVVSDLQIERELSVITVSLRVPNDDTTSNLDRARVLTDKNGTVLTNLSGNKAFADAANSATRGYLAQLDAGLKKLPDERIAIDHGASRASVMDFYSGLIQTTFYLYGSIAQLDDHALQTEANGVVGIAQASEFLAREDAIVAGIIASGNETVSDYTSMVATVNTKRFLYTQATTYLAPDQLALYNTVTRGTAYADLTKLEDGLVEKSTIGQPTTIDPVEWHNDYNAIATGLGIFEGALAQQVISATGNAATSKEIELAIAVGASFLMMLIVLIFSIRIARTLIRRVAGLRMDALSLALDRLPSVVGRLRRGEAVDLKAETPPLRYGFDELGQLGDAFTRVQETAIASAVQEANLRNGFNQVFLNIARRSQTLLHRQLSLLDAMERRTEDPDELEELFRVDHLATRMRRHAEDLVILAGSTPGRGWRSPIPFADVLRAAASEVEEYARISVIGVPEVGLAGRAVNDVVHLLAELLENATMFSPPDTQVAMSGQVVPNGFVIEIEDRGLGMSVAAIEDANARLAAPPDFDPANSSRLGLFVVSRLSARQGISVGLRRSPYGGVTAVALIPAELVVSQSEIGLDSYGGGLGARLPAPRQAPEDDTAERPIAGAAPIAVAVLESADDATMTLTMDGLPKRSRQASLSRQLPESNGRGGFADFGTAPSLPSGSPASGAGPTSGAGPSNSGPVNNNPVSVNPMSVNPGGFNLAGNGFHPANSSGNAGATTGSGTTGNTSSAGGNLSGNVNGTVVGVNGNAGGHTIGSGAHASPALAAGASSSGGAHSRTPGENTETGRSLEQMRSMLSSFQSGMELGRREASKPRHADTDTDTPDRPDPVSRSDGAESPEERHPE